MQQRYYDPLIGRFYSNDPVGFTASNPMMFNRYAYANNNPYAFDDPDGRNPRRAVMQMLKDPVRTIRSAGRGIKEVLQRAGVVPPPVPMRNESVPDDLAGIPIGSTGEVDDFMGDMNDRSSPDSNSGKSKVRTITDGTTVDEAYDNFPGESGQASDGSPVKTASDGSTAHVHSSSTDNGKKTMTVKRPNSKKPTKYREPEAK
jgi:uncharacterized protein RhaS with RHS repeats